MKNNYRKDIDALRAIAVIAVVLFHTDFELFSGGYVGVDIFFVISGYLITNTLKNQIELDNFKVTEFYKRRAIRLFPALFFVNISVIFIGYIFFDPSLFRSLGSSVASTSVFLSNFLFYKLYNYFDGGAFNHPLIHTWSLSVEEQFYLFFPLFMILTRRLSSRKLSIIVFSIIVISLSISVIWVQVSPAKSYYLLPSRIWELLFGSLISISRLPKSNNIYFKNIITLICLIAILFCITTFDKNTKFPGYNALIPVIGTALIIHYGTEGKFWVQNLLTNEIFLFIGLISYPLYLWNWPIVVFYKYLKILPLNNNDKFIILSLSFVLAFLTWKFLELPSKYYLNTFIKTKKIIIYSLFFILLFFITGCVIFFKNGFPERFSKNIIKTLESTRNDLTWEQQISWEDKIIKSNYDFNYSNEIKNDTPFFIFIGDSHVRSLMPIIVKEMSLNNIYGRVVSMSSTPPLLGFSISTLKNAVDFNENIYNSKLIEYIKFNKSIKYVIMHSRWASYTNGALITKNEDYDKPLFFDENTKTYISNNNQAVKDGLLKIIDTLQRYNKSVIIIKSIPEIGYDVTKVYSLYKRFPNLCNLDKIKPTLSEYQERQNNINIVFGEISTKRKIKFLDFHSKFFDKNNMGIINFGDSLIYRDGNHLSRFGAIYLKIEFDTLFNYMLRNK